MVTPTATHAWVVAVAEELGQGRKKREREKEGVRERRRILGSKAVLSYRAFQYMARAFEVAGVRVLEGKRRHPPSWWK